MVMSGSVGVSRTKRRWRCEGVLNTAAHTVTCSGSCNHSHHINGAERLLSAAPGGALLSWTLQSVYLSYTRAKKIITVVTKSLEKPLKRQFFIGSKLLTDVNLTFGGTLKLSWSLSLSRLCIASSCCADQRCLRPSLWTEEASQIKR